MKHKAIWVMLLCAAIAGAQTTQSGQDQAPKDPDVAANEAETARLNAEAARLNAEAARVTAKKAVLQAQQGAASALIPSIPQGNNGDIALSGSQPVEGVEYSYNALQALAVKMACKIKCDSGDRLIFFTAADIAGIEYWYAWNSQVKLLKGKLAEAVKQDQNVLRFTDEKKGMAPKSPVAAFGAVGPAIQSLVNLISLFRQDMTIKVEDTTQEEKALVAVLTQSVKGRQPECHVYYTAGVPPGLLSNRTPLDDILDELRKTKAELETLIKSRQEDQPLAEHERDKAKRKYDEDTAAFDGIPDLEKKLAADRKALTGEKDADKREELGKRIKEKEDSLNKAKAIKQEDLEAEETTYKGWKSYAEKVAGLLQLFDLAKRAVDTFEGNLLKQDDGSGATLMIKLRRSEALVNLAIGTEKSGYGLQVSVEKLASNTRTKKNIFLGTRLSFSGGAVASFLEYRLKEGAVPAGEVVTSGIFSFITDYVGQGVKPKEKKK